MFKRALILRALFAVFAPSVFIVGCEATDIEKYCEKKCQCNKCVGGQLDSCNDDTDGLQEDAFRANCRTKFDTYLACVSNDAMCTDGKYDETMCVAAEKDVRDCIASAPTCNTKNDGVCNEPAPAGDGTCPKGTDFNDCKPCETTNNGVCDEPAPAGNGSCLAGTDTLDCMVMTCATTNDGKCNEPAPKGDGTCAAGTDSVDCMAPACATTNDGVCDEPGGSGTCPAGTDTVDCTCATKNNMVCDEPEGTNTCPEASDSIDCTCATTNDGVCDEPQGTGKCGLGSDPADCAMCVTCAEYATTMMGTLCAASQPIYDSLQMCACGNMGACKTECAANFCMGGMPSAACGTCLQAGGCKDEFAVCANDI